MEKREQEILNKTVAILKKYLNPKTIYLFGSRSKAVHRKGSDFDIAVTGVRPESSIQHAIEDALETFSGLYTIDLIYLDSVEEDFRDLVLRQGEIIYEQ